MARTAIFDLDGTLADTAPDLVGAVDDLMRERGLPPPDAARARRIAGRGGKALITLAHEEAGSPLDAAGAMALYPRYLELYAARIDRESRLFDGVLETLDALAADGWRLGVCTNKPEALALDLLEKLGALRCFGAVLGADTLPVKKPDPRHLWETIDRVGGDRDRAVLIGDSETDRDTARAAETPILLVDFGYAIGPVGALRADAVVDDFKDIPSELARLVPRPEGGSSAASPAEP